VPETVTGVPVVDVVLSMMSTVYEVSGLPPLLLGALHERVAVPTPRVAARPLGAEGTNVM
jgi:hypothetical protein